MGWIGGSFGDPDFLLYNLLHTNGASNYGSFSNAEMDAALEEGRHSDDPAVRRAAYDRVQQLFRSEVPYIIGYHGSLYVIAGDEIGGLGNTVFFPSRFVGFTA